MNALYIALAAISIIPAIFLALFLLSSSQPGMVMNLAWITFLLLLSDFALSLTLLFIEEKLKRVEKPEQKS